MLYQKLNRTPEGFLIFPPQITLLTQYPFTRAEAVNQLASKAFWIWVAEKRIFRKPEQTQIRKGLCLVKSL